MIFNLDYPPDKLALGIGSDELFPIPAGEEFSIYIYIRNVTNLFGAAVQLDFSDDVMEFVRIAHNVSFWGRGAITIFDIDSERNIGIAWTRVETPKTQEPGKKEKLTTIFFTRTAREGTPLIRFTEIDKFFRITNPDAEPVDGFEDLKNSIQEREYSFQVP